MDILVNQIKKLIRNAIKNHSDGIEGATNKNTFINVYCKEESGNPLLLLVHNNKGVKHIPFSKLCGSFEMMTYKAMGFNVAKDTPVWLQKFLLKSAADHNYDITKPSYMLVDTGKELKAYMYVDGKYIKEIEIEYILQVK